MLPTRTFWNYSQKYFFSLLILFLFTLPLSAQDSPELPPELSGGEDSEVNIFLQAEVKEEESLKTKAEIFNKDRSGVYEGQVLSCPYAFERDLFVGTKGEDVRLLQVLLNSDRRTMIAVSGPGSLGQETDSFGESTKEAVKKFQTLFIEYVGVANGRFGPRTRVVMNAICNGENKPNNSTILEVRQGNNVFDNLFSVQRQAVPGGIASINRNTSADKTPPRLSLSANLTSVKASETFRVLLNASEEIVPITPDSVIVEGGSVKEIRKLSKTSYAITITPEEESKKVLVQIEADKVEDLNGNKNENASNEVTVKITSSSTSDTSNPLGNLLKDDPKTDPKDEDPNLNSLLDKIIASAPTCKYNGSGILVTIDPEGKPLNTTGCPQSQTQNQNLSGQTYNCNGQQIPNTQPCNQNPNQPNPNQQPPQQPSQTVCTQQTNLFGQPQLNCQQMTPQQAAAAQQAQQNQDLQRLLGQLMGRQGFGQGDNQIYNPNAVPQYTPPGQPVPEQLSNIAEFLKKEREKQLEQVEEARAQIKKEPEAKVKQGAETPAEENTGESHTPDQHANNNDRIVRELTACHKEYPAFRTDKNTVTTNETRTFLVKKGNIYYLLIAKKSLIANNVVKGACILQQPSVAKNMYFHEKFDACFKETSFSASAISFLSLPKLGYTNPSEHSEVVKRMDVKIYKAEESQLQAAANCQLTTSTPAQTQPAPAPAPAPAPVPDPDHLSTPSA